MDGWGRVEVGGWMWIGGVEEGKKGGEGRESQKERKGEWREGRVQT